MKLTSILATFSIASARELFMAPPPTLQDLDELISDYDMKYYGQINMVATGTQHQAPVVHHKPLPQPMSFASDSMKQPQAQANSDPKPASLASDNVTDKAKKYAAYVTEYIEGVVEIVLGVFLVFKGGPLIEWTVRLLLFVGITIGLFMGCGALNDKFEFYPDFKEKKDQANMIVGGGCILFGLLFAWLLNKYLVYKENILKIVAGSAAGFGVYVAVIGISMESWIKYLLIVAAFIAGFFLIRGNENFIISYATAFFGSVMMMHGLSCYVGGFPSVSNVESLKHQKLTTEFIGYLAGMVIFTIGGGVYQLRNVNEDEGFMGKDHA